MRTRKLSPQDTYLTHLKSYFLPIIEQLEVRLLVISWLKIVILISGHVAIAIRYQNSSPTGISQPAFDRPSFAEDRAGYFIFPRRLAAFGGPCYPAHYIGGPTNTRLESFVIHTHSTYSGHCRLHPAVIGTLAPVYDMHRRLLVDT
jgi:hypothetical protein